MNAGTVVESATVDQALERVLPAVANLLLRATGNQPHRTVRRDTREVRLGSVVRFPDGVGSGELVAAVFPYRGKVRADIVLEHDRMIATSDGVRTGTPCFLNDYQTSVTVNAETTELPALFLQRTVEGVKTAVRAVDIHRKREGMRWGAIHVARRESGKAGSPVLTDQAVRELFGEHGKPVITEWEDDEADE